MRILGIDPGTRALGYAIYDSERDDLLDVGLWELKGKEVDDRLDLVAPAMVDLLPGGCNIDLVAVERMFSTGNSADAALAVVAYLVRRRARCLGIPHVEIPAASVRKIVVGKGNAKKPEVLAYLVQRFGWEFPTTDASDAAAVAVAGASLVEAA